MKDNKKAILITIMTVCIIFELLVQTFNELVSLAIFEFANSPRDEITVGCH